MRASYSLLLHTNLETTQPAQSSVPRPRKPTPSPGRNFPSVLAMVHRLHSLTLSTPLTLPQPPEFSGTITHLGSSLKGDWSVGDRVVIEPVISCHSCYACDHGYNNACTSLGFIGLSGYGGGLSEYVAVGEEYLHRLPEGVSCELSPGLRRERDADHGVVVHPVKDGAMVEPLAVAMHAVEQSGMKKGDTALVLGPSFLCFFPLPSVATDPLRPLPLLL